MFFKKNLDKFEINLKNYFIYLYSSGFWIWMNKVRVWKKPEKSEKSSFFNLIPILSRFYSVFELFYFFFQKLTLSWLLSTCLRFRPAPGLSCNISTLGCTESISSRSCIGDVGGDVMRLKSKLNHIKLGTPPRPRQK